MNTLSHRVYTGGQVAGLFTSSIQAKQYACKLEKKGFNNITITS